MADGGSMVTNFFTNLLSIFNLNIMDLNLTGMLLNVIGALLIFIFGSPFSFVSPSFGIAYRDPSEKEKKIKNLSRFLSYLGMFLIVLGFSLQLYSLKR